MPSVVAIRLLLWVVAINAGLLLLMLWRRGLAGRVGYAILLGANVVAAGVLLVLRLERSPLAIVTIGAFVFLVIVPMFLRIGANWAMARGRLDLAIRLTAVRELLQPGAGVGREREILGLLREVQSGDSAEVLDRLMEQAKAFPDEQVQALLHELALTMLVVERRWEEAVAHGEAHVTPTHIAARPRLGAALIRAHGELGHIERIVQIMYLVEGGSGAEDPAAAEVVAHCRLMVLAFTGQVELLERLLVDENEFALMMEPKVRFYWLGVAYQCAGNAEQSRRNLERAQGLLGPEDEYARVAIAARLARLEEGCVPVVLADPEQTRRLTDAIRERVEIAQARPRLQGGLWRRTPVTMLLVAVNLVVYALVHLVGDGATDNRTLIQAGASLTHAVYAGEYWRLASAMFLHAGLFHLVLNTLMLWFLGRFCEQLIRPARFFVVYFMSGVAGNLASLLWRDGPVSVGASSSLFGILGASLIVLVLSRGRVPEGWRRSMVLVLALVIGLSFLPGLDVRIIDNYAHFGGLVGGVCLAALLSLAGSGRPGRLFSGALVAGCLAALLYCAWGLATSDLARLPWAQTRGSGVEISHPVTWYGQADRERHTLQVVNLYTADLVEIGRVGRVKVPTTQELLKRRLAETRQSLARRRLARRITLRELESGALARSWAGFRLDRTLESGQQVTFVHAFTLRGSQAPRDEWHALLQTTPKRIAAALPLFRRMLGTVRSAP